MARHRRIRRDDNSWVRFWKQVGNAWNEFSLERSFQKLNLPDEALPVPEPPSLGPPPPTRDDAVDYDDLERRAYARLRSWRLGATVEDTDAFRDNADWVKVRDNVSTMLEMDLRTILSLTREEFRAAASRYAPFWYH